MSTNQLFAFFWAMCAVAVIAIAAATTIAFVQNADAKKPYSTTVDGKTVVCVYSKSNDRSNVKEEWICK